MCLTKKERLTASRWVAIDVIVLLLPLLAAAIQSVWIVLVRGTHMYHALLTPDGSRFLFHIWGLDVWRLLLFQASIGMILVWPFVKFPNLHRVAAILFFGACLYFDFFQVTRWVVKGA